MAIKSFSTTFFCMIFKKKLHILHILGYMCIATVCFFSCGDIKFETNLIVLIIPFFYMTKMSRQKIKYLENHKSFLGEIKTIFHFQRAFRYCLRPDSAPLLTSITSALSWQSFCQSNLTNLCIYFSKGFDSLHQLPQESLI